jgi:hypothetical protein
MDFDVVNRFLVGKITAIGSGTTSVRDRIWSAGGSATCR